MSEIIVFPRSERAYSGPFTHPEIEDMRSELNLLEAVLNRPRKISGRGGALRADQISTPLVVSEQVGEGPADVDGDGEGHG